MKDSLQDFENEEIQKDNLNREKEINQKIFFLKIKQFILNIKHFPTLLIIFLKNSVLGLFKVWGIVFLIIIISFLYFTNSFSTLYYKIYMDFETTNIEKLEESIKYKQAQLELGKEKLSCYKNQFKRIADSEDIKIGFCKQKENEKNIRETNSNIEKGKG